MTGQEAEAMGLTREKLYLSHCLVGDGDQAAELAGMPPAWTLDWEPAPSLRQCAVWLARARWWERYG